MKSILRVGEGCALSRHRLKRTYLRHFSLLAVATTMCLYAHAQRPEPSGPALSGVVADTTEADVRDTLQIEEVIINAGYYTTTRQTSTGSIARVAARDIALTPNFNPIASLAARVPGLVVTQSNGIAGSSHHVQLRGRNSITQGSQPLYIVNGVPFATGGEFLNTMATAAGDFIGDPNQPPSGLSPFNLINAEDILSIEVLKDADALAIYGSRGANGVILITTKSGQEGTRFDIIMKRGFGRAPHRFRMLNTEEYLAMRREAFRNDGVVPSANPADPGYAPDIMLWDTTRYTDLRERLTGGTAHFTNLQFTASGGDRFTSFRIGSAYKKETDVFPGDFPNALASLNAQVSHLTADGRLHMVLTSTLSRNSNRGAAADLSSRISLPPNLPPLLLPDGSLNWQEAGYGFTNPLAYLKRSYRSVSETGLNNFTLTYTLFPGLVAKANLGYHNTQTEERAKTPREALDPTTASLPALSLANGVSSGWIAEPQLTYQVYMGVTKIDALVGGTWQHTERSNRTINGTDYSDDLLLDAIEAAGNLLAFSSRVEYRYQAAFGRVAINHMDRYIINLSGRRDGSSRFGPGKQYANFGAIGVAWVISNERFLRLPTAINFMKLRASYGLTGNDQINDYQFLDAWQPTMFLYMDSRGISPIRLSNADYAWENNEKLEAAVEMSFLNDRIEFNANYYRNRSGNQLINYRLPTITGFPNVLRNFGAVVQNRGLELSLQARHLIPGRLRWDIQFNYTSHRNKLLAFPNLAQSSYANSLVIGQPLDIRRGYRWIGLDPESGTYVFDDVDGDGSLSAGKDYIFIGGVSPDFYGGCANTFAFGPFSLNVHFEYRKQIGRSAIGLSSAAMPGRVENQPDIVLGRWHNGNVDTDIQRFGALASTSAYRAFVNFRSSTGGYVDASYIRCRSIDFAWQVPTGWVSDFGLSRLALSVQAQNPFLWSPYKVGDPETKNYLTLPPLRAFHFALSIGL